MRSKRTYFVRFFLLITLITTFAHVDLYSQNNQNTDIGISWDVPTNGHELSRQLAFYEQIGVRFIELKQPVNSAVLDSIANYPFQILIRFNRQFLTTSEIRRDRDDLIQFYNSLIMDYAENESVISYGLYSFSQSFDTSFIEEFKSITSELNQITNREFYEITSGPYNALDFSLYEISTDSVPTDISAFILSKPYQRNDQLTFKKLIELQPTLLFIDSNWLNEAIMDHPPLAKSLLDYAAEDVFILPLPQQNETQSSLNWPVLVFLALWISMGVHIAISQTYKPLIFRYFTGHRFFVDDIMRYRERSTLSGSFLFIQHSFFTGLVTYILSKLLISDKGLDALFHTIPQLAILGQNYFSLFGIGLIVAVIVQLIALAWLYLLNSSMTHFSQVLSLFTWPFHLDFVIVSVMLVLLITGGSTVLILLLGVLFIINWLTAFLLTSFDSSKYLMQKRVGYLIKTFGIHTIINIVLLVLLLGTDFITDFLELIIFI